MFVLCGQLCRSLCGFPFRLPAILDLGVAHFPTLPFSYFLFCLRAPTLVCLFLAFPNVFVSVFWGALVQIIQPNRMGYFVRSAKHSCLTVAALTWPAAKARQNSPFHSTQILTATSSRHRTSYFLAAKFCL